MSDFFRPVAGQGSNGALLVALEVSSTLDPVKDEARIKEATDRTLRWLLGRALRSFGCGASLSYLVGHARIAPRFRAFYHMISHGLFSYTQTPSDHQSIHARTVNTSTQNPIPLPEHQGVISSMWHIGPHKE